MEANPRTLEAKMEENFLKIKVNIDTGLTIWNLELTRKLAIWKRKKNWRRMWETWDIIWTPRWTIWGPRWSDGRVEDTFNSGVRWLWAAGQTPWDEVWSIEGSLPTVDRDNAGLWCGYSWPCPTGISNGARGPNGPFGWRCLSLNSWTRSMLV